MSLIDLHVSANLESDTCSEGSAVVSASIADIYIETGIQGIPGPTGPVGPIGPIGPQGEIGPQGAVGPQGVSADPIGFKNEIFLLNQQMVSEKKLYLSKTPIEESVVFIPAGGPTQIQNVDFSVTENCISWLDMGLDGTLDESDKIIVYYHWSRNA